MQRRTARVLDRRSVMRLAALGLAAAGTLRVTGSAAQEEFGIPLAIPWNIGPDEHWVDVNLTHQAAIGLAGVDVVRVAWVTSGMDGWETPEGEFRIVRRVYNETMTSAALGITDPNDQYVLTDVLFTQYFTWVGHALHLNYWRPDSVFGNRRTSHGCVGMRYADAEFFWEFLGIGDRVVIHS